MSEHVWDVVIVGSGPAGSAAAIGALSRDPSASVLMLDRHEFPRDKCCGDAVLDAALAELASYGLGRRDIVRDQESVDTLHIVSPNGLHVPGRIPGPITIVPRTVLDAQLCVAARKAGAVWRRHAVRSVVQRHTQVHIDEDIRARVLIGADGAESVVRRALVGAERRVLAVAIRGYATGTAEKVPQIVLDDHRGLAYAWRFPISNTITNVGYGRLLATGEVVSRGELLRKLHLLLPGVDVDPGTIRAHRLPLSTARQPVAHGRILLAGDAASLVNPLSGEGIYYAIASGLAAGIASTRDAPSAALHYRTALRRRFGRHHRHVAMLDQVIRSSGVLEAGLRAAKNNQRVFEDIAALGLGEGCLTPRLIFGMAAEFVRGYRPPVPRMAFGNDQY